MNMKSMALVLCIALAWTGSAAAGNDSPVGLQAILEQQRSLAADLDAGKTRDLKAPQVEEIRKAQRELFKVTEGKTDLDALRPDEKVVVMNEVERIKAIMAGTRAADEDKKICRRERTVGSQLVQTICTTKAEMEKRREMNREQMEKGHICEPPGCGEISERLGGRGL